MTRSELLERLKALVEECGSQSRLADQLDVDLTVLNAVLLGRRDPPPSLLKALGLKREFEYVSDGTRKSCRK